MRARTTTERNRRSVAVLLVVVAGLLMQLVLCLSGEAGPAQSQAATVLSQHDGGADGPVPQEQQPMVKPGSKPAKRIVSWQVGVLLTCFALIALLALTGPPRRPRGLSSPALPPSGPRLLTLICVCRP